MWRRGLHGDGDKEKLCRYVSDIFRENISAESVIGEHRLTAEQLIAVGMYLQFFKHSLSP